MTIRCDIELEDILEKMIANADRRITPVHVKDIGRRLPLNILSQRILAWPAHDLRADRYVQNQEPDISNFKVTDNDLMIDIAEGIELKVVKKDLATNTLEVAAYIQSNLDEFERYNLTVEHHNKEWRKNGSKRKLFDPTTGDMRVIPDSYVDPAFITSSSYPMPEHVDEEMSTGPLAKARPKMIRKPNILIRYSLKINKASFTLGYVAYDKSNKVVYYNEVTNKDLSVLVRRSVQEIWGNPFIFGDSGSVFDGISALIQGKKIAQCKASNTRPSILGPDDVIKERNKNLQHKEVEQGTLTTLERFCRVWVPLFTAIYFVWVSLDCFIKHFGGRHMPTGGTFLGCVFVCAIILTISFTVSYYAERKISEIDAEKKFI